MASSDHLDLAAVLECPVCLEIFPGRIHQCKNEHSICHEHVPNLANCPVCRISYLEGSSRNLLAETIAQSERARIRREEAAEREEMEKQRYARDLAEFYGTLRFSPQVAGSSQNSGYSQNSGSSRNSAYSQNSQNNHHYENDHLYSRNPRNAPVDSNSENLGSYSATTDYSSSRPHDQRHLQDLQNHTYTETSIFPYMPSDLHYPTFALPPTYFNNHILSQSFTLGPKPIITTTRSLLGPNYENHPSSSSNFPPSTKHPCYYHCTYFAEGCPAKKPSHPGILGHEEFCNFRPISCHFPVEGCHNVKIQFGQYIRHLMESHEVEKCFGDSHRHRFVVPRNGDRLVPDGSANMFVMFSENKNFLVRAVQWGEHIYVWVAYHGDLRQFSDTYRAEITLLLTNEDEPRGNQGDYRGARGGDDNDSVVIIDDDQETGQDGESESEEESEAESDNYLPTNNPQFSGRIATSARITLGELAGSGNYLKLPVSQVRENLSVITLRPNQFLECWTIHVLIYHGNN